MARKKLKPHWYKIYVDECAICGKTDESRERQFTPRPEDATERLDYSQSACSDHFL